MPNAARRPRYERYAALKAETNRYAPASQPTTQPKNHRVTAVQLADIVILPDGLGTRTTPNGQGNAPPPDMSDVQDLLKSPHGGTRIVRRKHYALLKNLPLIDGPIHGREKKGIHVRTAIRDVVFAISVTPSPQMRAQLRPRPLPVHERGSIFDG